MCKVISLAGFFHEEERVVESVDYTEYVIIGGVVNVTLVSSALWGLDLKAQMS